jgi:hypothetical protein
MFHDFKTPYFTCNFFTKFTYNEYIGPYFLSHVALRFSPSDLPGVRKHELPLNTRIRGEGHKDLHTIMELEEILTFFTNSFLNIYKRYIYCSCDFTTSYFFIKLISLDDP